MSGEENEKPVNIDPRCIQEALRIYFQPIKKDDPQLDFYTMYKRETMEYDIERMEKCNEDLNTTLIFAGLFSAVSSAFVIAVQSNLQQDSSGQSAAYLRAILLTLNRSLVPDEDPAALQVWNGPPAEIVTTSNLLYASLLMSLLAAFIAMLGKQWVNRYLRHTGGSMVERCGDRQRKFNGLERWPFRLFIESLPVILQIALLLLACGLSRYMWSVNTSVARVIVSFTVLGVLFYFGIVAAGTSSYECPFQTPASTTLRHLRDSETTRKLLGSLSPLKAISFICTTWKNTRQALVSASHRVYDAMQSPSSWEISVPRVRSSIGSAATKVGHQTLILLLRIDRRLGNAKQRLVQGIRRLRRAHLLPIAFGDAPINVADAHRQPGLLVRVRNVEALRKQNADNARCVCWVLWNITDPEAIDSAIRLASTIRWFDGDPDPPFDMIVSTFEACFDSTKRLYPGMRDRAYFSARAILQINTSARAQSHECASKYPIPYVSANTFQHTDHDFSHVIRMLEWNSDPAKPILDFPTGSTNTDTHSLWMSNFFVDVARVGPNPTLSSYQSYLSAAVTNHQAMIANTLLIWYLMLGGHVEEETFWAADKSDSLETILSHLSTTVMKLIGDGDGLQHLNYLLEFLAAWEERPMCLIPMAYKWCSAISEVAGRLELELGPGLRRGRGLGDRFRPNLISRLGLGPERRLELKLGPGPRLQPQDMASERFIFAVAEEEFSDVGPSCDPVRIDDASHHTRGYPRKPIPSYHGALLSIILEIGFRQAESRSDIYHALNHTSHHEQMFEEAFSSGDDEVIADALSVWIASRHGTRPGGCARYFAKRAARDGPLSPRLRRVAIRAIGTTQEHELKVSILEVVRMLDYLNVDVDGVVEEYKWKRLLMGVIRSPTGLQELSSHHWRLLGKLGMEMYFGFTLSSDDKRVMRSLEKAKDWEKLEVWTLIIWRVLEDRFMSDIEPMGAAIESTGAEDGSTDVEDVEQVTLKLLLQRPSALPRFEDLSKHPWIHHKDGLRQVCNQAREALQLLQESPPPLQSIHTHPLIPLLFAGDDTF